MANPTAAMLVIGDEILSGRTKDRNLAFLADALTKAAIDLAEARIVADDHAAIVAAVRALSKKWDHVFTSGGIGPTHDDITADAIADAFGAKIGVRDDARALLEGMYKKTGARINEARLRMARIPEGAILIDNPVSIAPGFSLQNVHVMAGVPAVFQAMVASVLSGIKGGKPLLSRSLRIDLPEGEIATPLAALAEQFPDVAIGSYPFIRDGKFGANIVFRCQDRTLLDSAINRFHEIFPKAREE